MPRFIQADYKPKYPEKYRGKYPIRLKSSWEIDFATRICDLNPAVVSWTYEPWSIPYLDPITGKPKVYIPDFLLTFMTPAGTTKSMLIEIKPMKEFLQAYATSRAGSAIIARNQMKQKAAQAWCARRGIIYKVMTEAEIYVGSEKKPPSKKKIKPFRPKKATIRRGRR